VYFLPQLSSHKVSAMVRPQARRRTSRRRCSSSRSWGGAAHAGSTGSSGRESLPAPTPATRSASVAAVTTPWMSGLARRLLMPPSADVCDSTGSVLSTFSDANCSPYSHVHV
jgi:hypothetical protein